MDSTDPFDLSNSIIEGMLSGGSRAEPRSALERSWQRAHQRFYTACSGYLLAFLKRRFPALSHDDASDVLMVSLTRLYLSLKTSFDPSKGKLGPWAITIVRRTAIDRIREISRRRRLETVELDADDEHGGDLHEMFGTDVSGADWAIAFESEAITQRILNELRSTGKRSPESIGIFAALRAGESSEEISLRLQMNRNKIDNLKFEITRQVAAIKALNERGVGLEEATKAVSAKGTIANDYE